MAAHRLPDALFAALARPPARCWLATPHAQATSRHTRTQDTAHRRTCRPMTRTRSMPSPPTILPQICPSIPLKRRSGASRAQSMHSGICLTLGKLAASQPAPTDALAGFSEHVSREHVTSAWPHRFVFERCFVACTATVSHAVGVELRLLSEAPGPARRDVDHARCDVRVPASREKGGRGRSRVGGDGIPWTRRVT